MQILSKYDLKQIRLIEKKINQFVHNKLDLFDLVTGLDGLLNVLESVTESWKNDFKVEINTLEMIRDSIEDGSISKWQGNFKEDIHKSVSKTEKDGCFYSGRIFESFRSNSFRDSYRSKSWLAYMPKML